MTDLPGFSFLFSRWPEVLLVAFMSGCVAGPLLLHFAEKAITSFRARRNERLLKDARTDIQIKRAMKDADKFGWVPREWL